MALRRRFYWRRSQAPLCPRVARSVLEAVGIRVQSEKLPTVAYFCRSQGDGSGNAHFPELTLIPGRRAPRNGTSMRDYGTARTLLGHIARAPRLAGRGLITAYRYSFSALVGFHCRHLP